MRKLVVVAIVVLSSVGVAVPFTSAYPSSGALPPPLTLVIPVAGTNGVPIDATGAALNVTVTNPAGPGFLTVYPCGDRPLASNLNYVTDQTVPNFVISALSADGDVCIDTLAVVDIVVDLNGYLPAGSPVVTLAQPTRIVDSRIGVGVAKRLQPTDTAAFQVGGATGVPADASMVLFNATAVDTGGPGFLTIFPCGEPIPSTSTLNFAANSIVPNFVMARLGAGGQVCAYTIAPMDLVVDVAGYVPAGAGGVVPLSAPQRILDTRNGTGGPVAPVGTSERAVQVTGVGGVPDAATGVIVNLTATQGSALGFVTAYPCGTSRPLASNLNFAPGSNVANMAVLRLGVGGTLCLVSNTTFDAIIDVTGYLLDDSVITSILPKRLYDTRDSVPGPKCRIGVRTSPAGVVIVDLATNDVIAGALLGSLQSARAFVRDDCQHIDVVGNALPVYWHGWEIDRSGNVLSSYSLSDSPDNVLFTNTGPLILHSTQYPDPPAQDVRDAVTNQVLFTLPHLSNATDGGTRSYAPVGATADQAMLILQSPDADRSHNVVSYWSLAGGGLSSFTAPQGASFFRVSPEGTYLSYTVSVGSVDSDLVISTLDGIEVWRLHTLRLLATPFWISDGALTICLPAQGVQVTNQSWNLFAPFSSVPMPHMVDSCLLAGT